MSLFSLRLAMWALPIALLVLLATPPALAQAKVAPTIADLVVAPAPDWTLFPPSTGNLTAQILFGDRAASVHGFKDAYRKVWFGPGNDILTEVVEEYDSTLWAEYRQGASHAASQRSSRHTSFHDVSGLGAAAYETSDPADPRGFVRSSVVFYRGDYEAIVTVASRSEVNQDVLMRQARAEFAILPYPRAEFAGIGAVVIGAVLLVLLVVGAVVAFALHTSRRAGPPPPPLSRLAGFTPGGSGPAPST